MSPKSSLGGSGDETIHNNPLARLHTHDLELGTTEAIEKHYARHVVSRRPVSQRTLDFERRRPRWLRECIAEAVGVFFYVFPGIAAVTTFTINKADAGFGSLTGIGFAFCFGIAFAIITCAPTSGGRKSPFPFLPPIHQSFSLLEQ